MKELRVLYLPVRLARPYRLSFGPIETFDSFFVLVAGEHGVGVGEITPLPGYSHETPETIAEDVRIIAGRLTKGEPLAGILEGMKRSSPFVASGFQCAIETSGEYAEALAERPACAMRLTALCDGADADEIATNAVGLQEQGYRTLKMKVGKLAIADELDRLRAAHEALGDGCVLRLDANQAYVYDDAARLCEGLEQMRHVQLLEQPFVPDAWAETERLASGTAVPIMMDESVWSPEDVEASAQVGAKWVKFKLCKHLGIQESLDLVAQAKRLGLGVVYGNGVQTAVGNHVEGYVHQRAGVEADSESNGFIKVATSPFKCAMDVEGGVLVRSGVDTTGLAKTTARELVRTTFR